MFYTNVAISGSKILLRGRNGVKRVEERIKYKPYLFINSPKGKYQTIHGNSVERKDFSSIWEAKQFLKQYKEVSNFQIYGMPKFQYPFINDNFSNMKYDIDKINVGFMDIETTPVGENRGFDKDYAQKAPDPVTAICMIKRGKGVLFGMKDYVPKDEGITYIKCDNEEMLLRKFLKMWKVFDLDIITGWNITGFDIPYLVNRIRQVLGEEAVSRLSPWGIVKPITKQSKIGGDPFDTYDIIGISNLDYIEVYKKFVLDPRESMKLDYIAHVELDEKKLDYSEHYSLKELYENDPEKFYDYNIHDTRLVERLEAKLKLLELAMFIAYTAKVNFQDTLASVIVWEVIIHNFLMKQNKVIPSNKRSNNTAAFSGGYVKEPIQGLLDWVVSFDATSLYPHIIILCNISPETLQKKLPGVSPYHLLETGEFPETDLPMAANGCLYSKDVQGFLPILMKEYFKKRKEFKDAQKFADEKVEEGDLSYEDDAAKFEVAQKSIKVLLNSLYGALGNEWFIFYNLDNAEAITLTGQFVIQWIAGMLNVLFNKMVGTEGVDYVIAIDTDSVYLNFGPLVKKLGLENEDKVKVLDALDKFCKEKIEKYMKECFAELYGKINAFEPALHMKREAIADRGFWRAKKRYALNVLDNEGLRYKEPDVKIVGLEAIRTTVPEKCRESIKKAINIILTKDNVALIKYIEEFRKEFDKLPFEEIASPSGVNGMDTYFDPNNIYIKGTPQHVKGALIYNSLLAKHNLTSKYPRIYNGDKIKTAYLTKLNPVFDTVISSVGRLPPELNLDPYIDRDKQFEKTFLTPLANMCETFGWHVEELNTIDDY